MIKNKINKTIIFAAAAAVFTIAGSAYYISSASNHLTERGASQVVANSISTEEAKDIAIAKAGSDYKVIEIELDRDDARVNYDIELKNGTNKIDAEIDANTGEILKWEVEKDDDAVRVENPQKNVIGEAKAKEIALNKAGSGYKVTSFGLDRDDARLNYDIELKNGISEIDAEIDAYTGEVLKWEVEKDDDAAQRKPAQQNVIGEAKAREIALAKAGNGFTIKEIELGDEDGRSVYEIEMVKGNEEIGAEIDAYTGKVIKWEVEIDD